MDGPRTDRRRWVLGLGDALVWIDSSYLGGWRDGLDGADGISRRGRCPQSRPVVPLRDLSRAALHPSASLLIGSAPKNEGGGLDHYERGGTCVFLAALVVLLFLPPPPWTSTRFSFVIDDPVLPPSHLSAASTGRRQIASFVASRHCPPACLFIPCDGTLFSSALLSTRSRRKSWTGRHLLPWPDLEPRPSHRHLSCPGRPSQLWAAHGASPQSIAYVGRTNGPEPRVEGLFHLCAATPATNQPTLPYHELRQRRDITARLHTRPDFGPSAASLLSPGAIGQGFCEKKKTYIPTPRRSDDNNTDWAHPSSERRRRHLRSLPALQRRPQLPAHRPVSRRFARPSRHQHQTRVHAAPRRGI
ncbi:hypothetical protein BDY21DRAFT_330913 [Lineolata rhizophorae]|uniref:Uncharacterized protein n=1 Tax=Lineolata rhizophorae TaxID=578093 RepID=A0A6A6PE55_9PEZI|nr:hypothetical protein BDY21DRAFT_330913 [Lineolata rhizophorae]